MLRSLFPVAVLVCAAAPSDYFQAIRAGDTAALKNCIAAGGVNQADSRLTTPLHYAAAFGNVESVRQLLAAGAKPNVTDNAGATPLLLSATSTAKAETLLAAGADPAVASRMGRTPLLIASAQSGATGAVKALLKAGANVNAADVLGRTPLLDAVWYGPAETVRLLLGAGADAKAKDGFGFTALHGAVSRNDLAMVTRLLKMGADPTIANHASGKVKLGQVALKQMTPLVLATPHGSPEMVKTLLAAGAKVNVRDARGVTPLIAAVSADQPNPQVLKLLLAAGADVSVTDAQGDSAANWAGKIHDVTALKLLPGARPPEAQPFRKGTPVAVNEAVSQALALLGKSSGEFFNQSGCIGCHNQPMTAMAFHAASKNGIKTSGAGEAEMKRSLTATRPLEPVWGQFVDTGGDFDTVTSVLLGAWAAGASPSPLTDIGVRFIAGRQRDDGSWSMFGIPRPPLEESNIARTGMAIRAMKAWAWPAIQPEIRERTERARAWLLRQAPRSAYERAELLLALQAAEAPAVPMKQTAAALLKDQRVDGGWSQIPSLTSDAYATGLVLHALHETGYLKPSDAAYRSGVAWLLRNQLDDGSWFVRGRSPKFQPYFESGFPHGHDQWISVAATAYATMALAPVAR